MYRDSPSGTYDVTKRSGVEALEQPCGGDGSPRSAGPGCTHPGQRAPRADSSSSVTAPWRLARRLPSGAEHERHVRVARHWQAEQPRKLDLARGGVEQVVAAHHLVHALVGVIDHHRELVGGRVVAAPEHEVVHHAGHVAVQPVLEFDSALLASSRSAAGRPERSRSVRSAAVSRRQVPGYAPSGSGPWGASAAAPDLGARAPARIHAPVRRATARAPRGSARFAPTGAAPRHPSRGRARAGPRSAGARARARERARSRSSIRSRKRPPPERANSQASSAVRRLPRCSRPLGLGAKRPSDSVPIDR